MTLLMHHRDTDISRAVRLSQSVAANFRRMAAANYAPDGQAFHTC